MKLWKSRKFLVVVNSVVALCAVAQVSAPPIRHGYLNGRLLCAVRTGHAENIPPLLASGADPNFRIKAPHTWLYIPSDDEMAEEIHSEPTVLMLAAMHGNRSCVQALLHGGANVDVTDNRGYSLKFWAAANPEIAGMIQKKIR
jgi:hypothetical protein